MAELSPYKLFPELLREQNTSHAACLLYRANLVTNHIDTIDIMLQETELSRKFANVNVTHFPGTVTPFSK